MCPVRMSKIESSTRIALEFAAAFNRRDMDALARLLRADCVFEAAEPAPDGTQYLGRDAVLQFLQATVDQLPPRQTVVEDAFGMGLHCVMRWRREWRDATGQTRRQRGVDIFKIENDLICERLTYIKG